MKKSAFKSIILPIIIWLTASATIIAFACSFWYIFFGLISLFPVEEKVYHRPAFILNQPECLFGDDFGNAYAYTQGISGLYKFDEDNNISLYDAFEREERMITSACSNKTNLFVFSYKYSSPVDFRVDIFNKRMEIVKVIYLNNRVTCSVATEKNLYSLSLYYSEEKSSLYRLIKYDISSFEELLLMDNFETNSLFVDGENKLFLQENDNSSRCNLVNVTKSEAYHCYSAKVFCYHPFYGTFFVENSGNQISINRQEKQCLYSSSFEHQRLYNKVYIVDDYLLFAIREYVENDECLPRCGGDCICHFGQSMLLIYDFANNCFLEPKVYPVQSVLLDYDLTGSFYYYAGGLYNHNSFVRTCQTINNNGTITVRDGYYSAEEVVKWQIIYFEDKFWGI